MDFRTNEGAQARGLLAAARTKYSRSKAQHIRELCYKDARNTAILGNYAIKSMEMSRIKGGLGEIQRFFCPFGTEKFPYNEAILHIKEVHRSPETSKEASLSFFYFFL
jgi:hypothetical protein